MQPPEFEVGDRSAEVPSLEEYVAETVSRRLATLLSHVEGVRAGKDVEPIHQMRVWSRRLRAVLEVYGSCCGKKAIKELNRESKAITGALGEARDLDVMIEGLTRRAETLPPSQRAGIDGFIEGLRQWRATLQQVVIEAVTRFEHYDPARRFAEIAARRAEADGPHTSADADGPHSLFAHAAVTIHERLDALLQFRYCLADPAKARELHEMRIAAKRLRYTMEIFEDVYRRHTSSGKAFSAAIKQIRSLQEQLGQIHDADVLAPQLIGHLALLLAPGHGKGRDQEPVLGVDRVDLDACQGVLTLCQEIARDRSGAHERLLEEWKRLEESGFFTALYAWLERAPASEVGAGPADMGR